MFSVAAEFLLRDSVWICYSCSDKDVIGLAQTGSGKTAAFALPILQSLLDKPQPFFALVMSPTRELALQISDQFKALGSGIAVKCTELVGGMDKMAQVVAIGRQPHVIVGTPGRIVDHLINTKVTWAILLVLRNMDFTIGLHRFKIPGYLTL